MLEIKNLFAGYDGYEILKSISITLEKNTLTSIIGTNGCGKSTLLNCISGQLKPFSGEIILNGSPISKYSPREYAQKLSYLRQTNDIPAISVNTLTLHGRFPYLGFPRKASEGDRRIARLAMESTGTWELRERLLPALSGGERQRAFLSMALAQDTQVILLDEPSAGLDIGHQLELMQLLSKLRDNGKTIAAVLHDIDSAIRFSNKICLIDNGGCAFFGTPKELLATSLLEDVFGVTLTAASIDNETRIIFGKPKK